MVVYNIRLGYDGSPNGIHGVGGVLDIPPPGSSPPCGAKGWLPGNRVRPVSWEYDPCDYGGFVEIFPATPTQLSGVLNQDEQRTYAKELSVEAE